MGFLLREFQFFQQFLPRAGAGELDFNILVGAVAAQADHVAGQVVDGHRLPHIQDKGLPAMAEGSGVEHQLHRLRNGHKIPAHLPVGDGHRASPGDLFPEDGHHAPLGIQHIAEPHRAEPGGGMPPPQQLQTELRPPFGGPHDAGGIDRLVGGDEDEQLRPRGNRRLGRGLGAQEVVFYRFAGAGLHHGHVFVGRCVKDDGWAVLFHQLVHTALVPHRAHFQGVTVSGVEGRELSAKLEESVFRNVKTRRDDPPPAEGFGGRVPDPMEPAPPGDQHCFPGEQGAQGGGIQSYCFPPEEVLRVDLPQPCGGHFLLLVKEPEPLEGKTLGRRS